jgi:hypothetical protein
MNMEEEVDKLVQWYSRKNNLQSHTIYEDAQKLVDLGIAAVPYLIKWLFTENDYENDIYCSHWMLVYVIISLTHYNPIKDGHQGRYDLVISDFKEWWETHKDAYL